MQALTDQVPADWLAGQEQELERREAEVLNRIIHWEAGNLGLEVTDDPSFETLISRLSLKYHLAIPELIAIIDDTAKQKARLDLFYFLHSPVARELPKDGRGLRLPVKLLARVSGKDEAMLAQRVDPDGLLSWGKALDNEFYLQSLA